MQARTRVVSGVRWHQGLLPWFRAAASAGSAGASAGCYCARTAPASSSAQAPQHAAASVARLQQRRGQRLVAAGVVCVRWRLSQSFTRPCLAPLRTLAPHCSGSLGAAAAAARRRPQSCPLASRCCSLASMSRPARGRWVRLAEKGRRVRLAARRSKRATPHTPVPAPATPPGQPRGSRAAPARAWAPGDAVRVRPRTPGQVVPAQHADAQADGRRRRLGGLQGVAHTALVHARPVDVERAHPHQGRRRQALQPGGRAAGAGWGALGRQPSGRTPHGWVATQAPCACMRLCRAQ